MMKRVLAIGAVLLVAPGAGWVWGASGLADLNRALRIAELRDGLLEGRAAVLDARLDIYSVNFGDASRQSWPPGGYETVGARASEDRRGAAQRMAGQLNQDANALVAEVSNAINDVLNPPVKR